MWSQKGGVSFEHCLLGVVGSLNAHSVFVLTARQPLAGLSRFHLRPVPTGHLPLCPYYWQWASTFRVVAEELCKLMAQPPHATALHALLALTLLNVLCPLYWLVGARFAGVNFLGQNSCRVGLRRGKYPKGKTVFFQISWDLFSLLPSILTFLSSSS